MLPKKPRLPPDIPNCQHHGGLSALVDRFGTATFSHVRDDEAGAARVDEDVGLLVGKGNGAGETCDACWGA